LARSCSTSNSTAFAFIPPATTSARASTSIVDDDATLTVVGGFGDINDILNACGGVIDALRTVIVVVVVVVSLCLAARVSASSIICVDLNVPIPPCPTLTGVRTSSSSSPSPTITKLFLVADVVAIVVANLRALASARLAVSLIFILDALVSVSTRIFRADARADDITRSASDRTVVARAPFSRTGVTGSSFSSTFVSSSRSRGVDSSRARVVVVVARGRASRAHRVRHVLADKFYEGVVVGVRVGGRRAGTRRHRARGGTSRCAVGLGRGDGATGDARRRRAGRDYVSLINKAIGRCVEETLRRSATRATRAARRRTLVRRARARGSRRAASYPK
jgi:hypothetical protein